MAGVIQALLASVTESIPLTIIFYGATAAFALALFFALKHAVVMAEDAVQYRRRFQLRRLDLDWRAAMDGQVGKNQALKWLKEYTERKLVAAEIKLPYQVYWVGLAAVGVVAGLAAGTVVHSLFVGATVVAVVILALDLIVGIVVVRNQKALLKEFAVFLNIFATNYADKKGNVVATIMAAKDASLPKLRPYVMVLASELGRGADQIRVYRSMSRIFSPLGTYFPTVFGRLCEMAVTERLDDLFLELSHDVNMTINMHEEGTSSVAGIQTLGTILTLAVIPGLIVFGRAFPSIYQYDLYTAQGHQAIVLGLVSLLLSLLVNHIRIV